MENAATEETVELRAEIPADLHQRMRVSCAMRRETVRDWVREAIERYVQTCEQGARR